MKALMIALSMFVGGVALAGNAHTSPAQIHTLTFDEHTDIEIRMVAKDVVTDGCNHYGLSGEFRVVEVPEGTSTIVQDFVADFAVISTEMACSDETEPGLVTLESKWYTVTDASYVHVYAPAEFELEVRVP